MKLIIAGGRDYDFNVHDYNHLDALQREHHFTEVVSGGATGADSDGESWAHHWKLPVKRFPADWALHGKKAGPLRNAEMAAYADAVALFPGGKGTESMRREDEKAGIKVFDFTTPPVMPRTLVN